MALAKYEEDNRLITDERLSHGERPNFAVQESYSSLQTTGYYSKILEISKIAKAEQKESEQTNTNDISNTVISSESNKNKKKKKQIKDIRRVTCEMCSCECVYFGFTLKSNYFYGELNGIKYATLGVVNDKLMLIYALKNNVWCEIYVDADEYLPKYILTKYGDKIKNRNKYFSLYDSSKRV